MYQTKGIDLLALKGLGISPYYPIEEYREFVDMDIYIFDKHTEANEVVKKLGIDMEYDEKHDMFEYKGIHVEHHNTFISIQSKSTKQLNLFLEKKGAINNCTKHELGFWMPNANFNAVFLLRHLVDYFAYEGLTIKNILD